MPDVTTVTLGGEGTTFAGGAMRVVIGSRAARRLGRSRAAQLGLLCVVAVVASALLGPLFVGDPTAQDLLRRLKPPAWMPGGDPQFLLGTDQLGRDLLTRVVYGARISLLIALLAVILAGSIGVTLGLFTGYYGGIVDGIVMRLAEIQLAFPFILLVILVVGAIGPSVPNLVLVLGMSGWILYARVVRGQVLAIREMEFIVAARCLGIANRSILMRHVLPNAFSPVIVVATFAAAQVIIAEAALSFLGLGIQPPDASWGGMLSDSRAYLTVDSWLALMPGLAIMIAVVGLNLLGDWLRDVLDPRLRI